MRDNDTGFTKVKKNIGTESVRKEWSTPRLIKIESSKIGAKQTPPDPMESSPANSYNPS